MAAHKMMHRGLIMALVLLVTALLAAPVAAQSFAVARWTVDGGGAASQGGDYALTGTAGQPDAGVMSGGDFTLIGGFWGGYPPSGGRVYLPATFR